MKPLSKKPLARAGCAKPGNTRGTADDLYKSDDPEIQRKLDILKSMEGMWADKDPSFFDEDEKVEHVKGDSEMELIKREVYLTQAQDMAVRQRAKAKRISDSEVIQMALDVFLRDGRKENDDDNWFVSLIGAGTAKPGHSSETIDRDLYAGKLP